MSQRARIFDKLANAKMLVRFDALKRVFFFALFINQSLGLDLRAAKTRKQLAEAILRIYVAKDGTRMVLNSVM